MSDVIKPSEVDFISEQERKEVEQAQTVIDKLLKESRGRATFECRNRSSEHAKRITSELIRLYRAAEWHVSMTAADWEYIDGYQRQPKQKAKGLVVKLTIKHPAFLIVEGEVDPEPES